jgi:hypothetical protein
METSVNDPKEGMVVGEGGEMVGGVGIVGGESVESGPEEVHREAGDGCDGGGGVRGCGPELASSKVHSMNGREADKTPHRTRELGARGKRGGSGEGGGVEEPEGGA